MFRTDTDPTTLEVAAATLGHLVQTGGALTADVVVYEVSKAPECGDSLPYLHQPNLNPDPDLNAFLIIQQARQLCSLIAAF